MFTSLSRSGAGPHTGVFARTRQRLAATKRFAADSSGGVAIPFALSVILMCLFVGAAVDFGRWLHARYQTIAAMDAAVLAGGRVLQLDENNLPSAIAAAKAFYAENTKNRLKLVSDNITFTPTDDKTAFTATGNAYIETPLLRFVSINSLPLLSSANTEYSKAQLAVGGSGKDSVELGLMLDVTTSMKGSKTDDMKAAAKDLVDVLITTQSAPYTRISLVPFSEGVRLPSSANTAARGSPANSIKLPSPCGGNHQSKCTTYYRTPCVVERKGTDRYTDVAPGPGNYVMTLFSDNKNGKCALDTSAELVPLTNDKDLLKNSITNLSISGSTAGQTGTAWAWYTLSPNWNALWSSASNQALAYGSPGQKIAVLMTDGEYNLQYDANGVVTGSSGAGSAANDSSTNQARALCTAMKKAGIKVYTVGFDLGGNQTAVTTLTDCASDSTMAYNADNGDQLKQAFRDIALKISQLYLSK